ncbi:tandem-95 repeat protein, partial [Aliikangiella coralliicola]
MIRKLNYLWLLVFVSLSPVSFFGVLSGIPTVYAWDQDCDFLPQGCGPVVPLTNFRVVEHDGTSIARLQWDYMGTQRNYLVERKASSGTWTPIYFGTSTLYTDMDLPQGTYQYRGKNCNNLNECSDWSLSEEISVIGAPLRPWINLSGSTYIDDTFTLTYASEPAIVEYTVERDGETIYVGASPSLAQTLPLGSYDYRVKARNNVGSSDWGVRTVTVRDRVSIATSESVYNSDDNILITVDAGGLSASDLIHYQLDDGEVITKTERTHQFGVLSGGSHLVKVWGEYTDNNGQHRLTSVAQKTISIRHRPIITAQNPLSVDEENSLTISLDDFTVEDADSPPHHMIFSVGDGDNYAREGTQITPNADFDGTLSVPIIVSDGQAANEPYHAMVTVNPVNDKPVISAGAPLPAIDEDTSLAIALSNLVITDVDSSHFTVNVQSNMEYTPVGDTVIPHPNFHGTLTVKVSVSDGQDSSNIIQLPLVVNSVNDKPVIHRATLPAINEDGSLAIDLSQLLVTDVDSSDLTLTVLGGSNYSTTGNTVTPNADFNGTLTVPLQVSDGIAMSDVFNASVTVNAVNDKPVINSHSIPAVNEDSSLTIQLSHLNITDVDSSSFTLTVGDGANYSRVGNVITPDANFHGALTVSLTVSDGSATSDPFNATVTVNAVNDKPVINSHTIPAVNEDSSLTIQLSHLDISDVDSNSFTVTVHDGANYSKVGNTIAPEANFNGTITIPVTVNDGSATSDTLNASVTVNAINDAPVIAEGDSQSIATDQEQAQSLTLNASDIDSGTLTWSEYTSPSHGGVSGYGQGLSKVLTYTPSTGFGGVDSFVVQVSDGIAVDRVTVTVQVNQVDQEFAEKFSGIVDDAALVTPSVPANEAVGAVESQAGVSGGAATYSVPIAIPPGRNGMQPNVSLNYSSRSGNGIVGVGWSLAAGAAIHRCTATYAQDGFTQQIQYSAKDRLCLNGSRLMAVSGVYGMTGTEYRTELDSFVRVKQHGGDINDTGTWFSAEFKGGSVAYFGKNGDSRLVHEGMESTFKWLIEFKHDLVGNSAGEAFNGTVPSDASNFIHYVYQDYGAGEKLLRHIYYTGSGESNSQRGDRRVELNYESRINTQTPSLSDKRSGYIAGGYYEQTQRLKSIKTFVGASQVNEYELTYQQSDASKRSLLANVKRCAFDVGASKHCLPVTSFNWMDKRHFGAPEKLTIGGVERYQDVLEINKVIPIGDFDGDGTQDFPGFNTNAEQALISTNDITRNSNCHRILEALRFQCIEMDLDRDGVTDNYKIEDYKLKVRSSSNKSAGYVTQMDLYIPSESNDNSTIRKILFTRYDRIMSVTDMNGDGYPDLVAYIVNRSAPNRGKGSVKVFLHNQSGSSPYFETTASYSLALNSKIVYPANGVFDYDPTQSAEVIGDIDGNGLPDLKITTINTSGYGSLPFGSDVYFLLNQSTPSDLSFENADGPDMLRTNRAYNGEHAMYEQYFAKYIDINGDGLQDVIGWQDRKLVVKLNQGGTFGDAMTLAPDTFFEQRFYTMKVGVGVPLDIVYPKYNESMSVIDINGDGRSELLVPGERIVTGCAEVAGPVPADTSNCGDGLYGAQKNPGQHDDAPNTAINSHILDDSIYRYDVIYFDEDADGNFTARKETSPFIGSAFQVATLDAFGDGNVDMIFTFGPRKHHPDNPDSDEANWIDESLTTAEGKQIFGENSDQYGAYIIRNYGGGQGTSASDYNQVDVIQSVTNGLNATHQWRYRPLSTGEKLPSGWPIYKTAHEQNGDGYFHFSSSLYVVNQLIEPDGIGGNLATNYAYRGAMFNHQGRGFQGFRTIITDTPATVDSSGAVTENIRSVTDFHQKFPKAGKIEEVRTCLASDGIETCSPTTPLSYTKNIYFEKKTAESSDTNSE